jgi:hypothetical protein
VSLVPAICAVWLAAATPDEAPASPPPQSATPSAPPSATQGEPEGSIAEAYKAAEGQQGSLDGTWRLEDPDGGLLYVFQISDPGGGSTIEGAWRDPHHLGATNSSGFLTSISRNGDGLDIRFGGGFFAPHVVLKPTLDGGWAGDLIHDGPRRRVVMSRF